VTSRRLVPPSAEGRWSLVRPLRRADADPTKWLAAVSQQLLARYGVLTRESVAAENLPGGFSVIYPVLKAMEEKGRLRRGYFVAGLGATQFALPGALDLLRSLRYPSAHPPHPVGTPSRSDGDDESDTREDAEVLILAATDPANPYGGTLKWPSVKGADDRRTGRGPTRSIGASVVLVDGALAAYLARGDRQLYAWLPDVEPGLSRAGRSIARALIARARTGGETPRGMLIEQIDGEPPERHALAPFLARAGFLAGALGFQATFPRRPLRG
jgi:ATP-dependent Lhr-like helicase